MDTPTPFDPAAPKLFSKQLFTELRQLDYIPLDAELERYYQSLVKMFRLAQGRKPDQAERQRMRLNILVYLGSDLEHSPEYSALHQYTRTVHNEFPTGNSFERTNNILKQMFDPTTIRLKTDDSNNIAIVKAPYNNLSTDNDGAKTLHSYASYMAIDSTLDKERILAAVFMSPAILTLENLLVVTYHGSFVFNEPQALNLMDEELLPRLLGGSMGCNGVCVASTLNPEAFVYVGYFVAFAFQHGGAVYVFKEKEKTTQDKQYLMFSTLEEFDRGIGNYCGDSDDAADWGILIAYKQSLNGANVQPAI